MTSKIGQLQMRVGARGAASYWVEAQHPGLHKYRLVRGPDVQVVQALARVQAAEWDAIWSKKVAASQRIMGVYAAKEARRLHLERQKEEATNRSTDAQQILQTLRGLLTSSLPESKAVDWEILKDRSPFPKSAPIVSERPAPPKQDPLPVAPTRSSPWYRPELGLLDKLIKARRIEKENRMADAFEKDTKEWEANRDHVLGDQVAKLEAYHRQLTDLESAYAREVLEWESERTAFMSKQQAQHEAIDAFRARYEGKDPEAVTQYCDMVLANSEYPECLPKEFDLDFNHDAGLLVVNYKLPAPTDVPTLSEVKYVQSSDSFSEKHLSEVNAAKLYDDLIYQIALRTLNELLEADQVVALTASSSTVLSLRLTKAPATKSQPALSRYKHPGMRSAQSTCQRLIRKPVFAN